MTWDLYLLDFIRYAVLAHRCSCLFQIVSPSTKKYLPSRMINAGTHELNAYSVEEITGGIICRCLPAFLAFTRHVSDMKVRLMKATPDSSQSTFTSRSSNIKQPAPTSLSSLQKFVALSPSAKTHLSTQPRTLYLQRGLGKRIGKGIEITNGMSWMSWNMSLETKRATRRRNAAQYSFNRRNPSWKLRV